MRYGSSKRIIFILVATLLALSVNAAAQAAQAPQNENIWQKLKKSAKQTGQNAAQQGGQQAQQMQQQVQQQVPVIGGQPYQANAAQQVPCGNGANGAALNNAAYNTTGGADGSCGPQCFNAGPFAAAVTQMTMSQQGYWHIIRMNLQFQNLTDQPLIIAYHEGSMVMVDNLGNTYQAAGGNPGAVQGMGIDRGNQTDSQFVLGPGQTGNALYSVARSRGNDSAIGTGFSYNFTIDELQAQNGAQAIAVRQYNLNLPTLTPGASGAALPGQGVAPASGGIGNRNGVSSYVGGSAAPGIANPGMPTQVGRGAVAGGVVTPGPGVASVSNVTGVKKNVTPGAVANPMQGGRAAAVGGAATPIPAAGPTQPGAMNRAIQNNRVPVAATQNPVNNAALRSNVPAAKPAVAPAAQPVPAKTPAKPAAAVKPTDPAAKK